MIEIFQKMNIILSKTRLAPLRCSMYKIKKCVFNIVLNYSDVERVKSKEALTFLQNGFTKVSLKCTNSILGPEITLIQKRNCPDTPGSGAGKSDRESEKTGSVGKFGDVNEELFFYKQNQAQIERLKLELQKKGQEKSNAPEKKDE